MDTTILIVILVLLFSSSGVYFYMEQQKQNAPPRSDIERLLIKYSTNNKERFMNTDLGKEFLDKLPQAYKAKVQCEELTDNFLNCLMGQLAGDATVSFETTGSIVMILNWIKYGVDAFTYDRARGIITMPNDKNKFGKLAVTYDEYIKHLKGAYDAFKSGSVIENKDCGCN